MQRRIWRSQIFARVFIVCLERTGQRPIFSERKCLFLFMILATGIAIAYFQPDVRTATMIAFAIIVLTLVIKKP